MGKRLLTDEQDKYLRSIALGKSIKECTEMINNHFGTTFKESQIHTYKSNHKISSGKKPWEFVDHSKQRILTEEQGAFISNKAAGIGNVELTDLFNTAFGTKYTVKQIKSYKSRYGISSGLTGHFPKGNVPINKGKSWDEYMPKESQEGCRKTIFKKGLIPPNYQPIGTEMLRKDGYIYVKISDKMEPGQSRKGWRLKHHLLWEQHHGPVPKGYKVVFANSNRNDIRLDNLVLVTDSELLIMNRHGLIYEDIELTRTGANIAKIIDSVNKRKINKKGR